MPMSQSNGAETEKWGSVQNMFALIIGIDEYQHLKHLGGAVADAEKFESFLLEEVMVKKDRIIKLHNKDATRSAIANAFRHLWECSAINPNDSIVIYYAGHGCTITPPEGLRNGGKKLIEAICPYDMTRGNSSNGNVHPIPDFTIAFWLNRLSSEKGNNITLIFDCCHSAGTTRDQEVDGVRLQNYHGDFPDSLKREDTRSCNPDIGAPLDYNYQHSRSHILLAACSEKELAHEENREGLFTKELIRALKIKGADQSSFLEFMDSLRDIERQNKVIQTPQCYGHHKNRVIFSMGLKPSFDVFRTSWGNEPQTLRIEAGPFHGVDKNSLFELYGTADLASKPLCTVTAREVHSRYTIAVAEVDISGLPSGSVARQLRCGNPLKVHFSSKFLQKVDQQKLMLLPDIRHKVMVDEAMPDFRIDVDSEGKKAVFVANMKAVTHYNFTQLPNSVPVTPEDVCRVLLAASRWKQHLQIPRDSSSNDDIQIKLFRLEMNSKGPGFRPEGNQLNTRNDLVHVHVASGQIEFYGMEVYNNTGDDLHFSMLAFDISDLDIEYKVVWSKGVGALGAADPNLPSKIYLPIGFGSGGVLPFVFKYPRGPVNVTILKMYFTTHPTLDLTWLEQPTPFAAATAPKDKRHAFLEENVIARLIRKQFPIEFTKTFTIVQHPNRGQ